jgi:hypothetical protein
VENINVWGALFFGIPMLAWIWHIAGKMAENR